MVSYLPKQYSEDCSRDERRLSMGSFVARRLVPGRCSTDGRMSDAVTDRASCAIQYEQDTQRPNATGERDLKL
jgi:hypothetical protein